MKRNSQTISPTAHYTGQVWARHGLSHRALETAEGRWLHRALSPIDMLSRVAGTPSLEGLLLARHRAIDHLLETAIRNGEIGQVIEIAAGFSPRGWRFMQHHGADLWYIEADLPHMAVRKQQCLHEAGLLSPGHRIVSLDALAESGPQSLAVLAETLDPARGLAIVTEGLLNYFDRAAVLGFWARFSATLARFPRGIYLSDLHLSGENRGVAVRSFAALLSVFVRGKVHLHFRNAADAEDALLTAGFAEAQLLEPRHVLPDQPMRPGAEKVRVIAASSRTS